MASDHKIKLNETVSVDLRRLVATKLLAVANSGGGKSWLIRRLVEQAYGKVQIIILDPEGEFASLREKYDFILCGKGMDAPAEPRSAALLARKLLEAKASAVIDLYELHPQERKRFVRLFLDSMVNAPKELYNDCLIILDEAHKFAPEKEESEAAGAVIEMASLGRKRGFCLIPVTQRISKLSKDVAAECNNKLMGRASLDLDRKRTADELGITNKDEILALRNLEPGEFFAFGPAISNEVIRLKVGPVQTTIPKAGRQTKVAPPSVRIKKELAALADLPQEAEKEASTSAELQKQVRSLTAQLRQRPVQEVPKEIVKTVEVPVLKEAQIVRLENAVKAIVENLKLANHKPIFTLKPITTPVQTYAKPSKPSLLETTDGVTGPEQRILNAIAWMESIGVSEPEQTAVAFLADYTYGGGGFNNPKGSLRTKGLIEYRGSRLALTDAGRELAQTPDIPLTTEELHQKVLARLPGPERRLLTPLLNGAEISNEELAEASGYVPNSGGFNNPKGRLRTLGLVEYPSPGRVKASSILFI